jgi:hypothetical protein
MLTEALLSLLGLIAVAVLASLIVTPIIVRLLERVVAFTVYPIRHSDNSEREVYPPNHIHDIRGNSIDSEKMYGNPIANLSDKYRYESRDNCPQMSMLKQPNTTTVDKLLKVLHRVILFYSSYYGHSTKVEKNQLAFSYQLLLFSHYYFLREPVTLYDCAIRQANLLLRKVN